MTVTKIHLFVCFAVIVCVSFVTAKITYHLQDINDRQQCLQDFYTIPELGVNSKVIRTSMEYRTDKGFSVPIFIVEGSDGRGRMVALAWDWEVDNYDDILALHDYCVLAQLDPEGIH